MKQRDERGSAVMTGKRNRAVSQLAIFGVGIVGSIGLLVADWYFTALPLFGIMPAAMAWAASILTSPIEAAGVELLTEQYAKHELSIVERWFWALITPLVLIADVVTNVMGLYYWALDQGTVVTDVHMFVIVVVGIVMALVEYLLAGFLIAAGRRLADYQEASAWLEQHGYGSDFDPMGALGMGGRKPRGQQPHTIFGDSPQPRRSDRTYRPRSSRDVDRDYRGR